MVVGRIAVEANFVDDSVNAYLEAGALDAEDKVANDEVVTLDVDKKDIMETKVRTLMLTFPDSPKIFTNTILHLITTNGIIISHNNRKMKSWHYKTFGIRTAILTI